MALQANPDDFKLPPELVEGIRGKRVFITGGGRDRGLGQAFSLAAGLNGAESVGVHFYRSYDDGLETVEMIRQNGGHAFPVQADVTNPRDVWAMRSHVIRKMGDKPPNVVICNSGASEHGYLLGRPPRELKDETSARRRARTRQTFVDNLKESRLVIDTKLDGFLAMTHLWAGEAVYANEPLTIIYISSRQAVDPGAGVPGYCAANWSVLMLPRILRINLGRKAELVTAFSVGYPFVHTSMTAPYVDNAKVFGRWQPRMLEPFEASQSLMQLLARPKEDLDERFFQLNVMGNPHEGDRAVRSAWSEVRIDTSEAPLEWAETNALNFKGE